MSLNPDVRQMPWKKISIIAGILLLVAGVAAVGFNSMNKPPRQPVTPEENQATVMKYLKEKAQTSEFRPNMELTKEKNPWNTLKVQYDTPPDYKTVYRNIGEHLILADHLIRQENNREQVNGLRIVTELCDVAISVAVDPWLAARISDGYLVPNLEKVDEKPKNGPSREQFVNLARKVYREAEESNRLIELSKSYLAQAANTERADRIRWSLARELEQAGEFRESLKYLREISHSSLTNDAARRITSVEQKLNNSAKK